jgi:hypothetical protein
MNQTTFCNRGSNVAYRVLIVIEDAAVISAATSSIINDSQVLMALCAQAAIS